MKRLIFGTVMGVVLVGLAACQAVPAVTGTAETDAPPTVTPEASHTPAPTLTETPTETATYLPSPSPEPSHTASPTLEASALQTAEAVAQATASALPEPPDGETAAVLQAAPDYDSNLRAGPGLTFDILSNIRAGEVLDVLARDGRGRWLLVRTTYGDEGWVAVMQFPASLAVAAVPVADGIPEPPPEPSHTPDPNVNPEVTPTPGLVVFELPISGEVLCQSLSVPFAAPFPVGEVGQVYAPFNMVSPGEISNPVYAFQLDREAVPFVISLYVDGNVKARGCVAEGPACSSVTLTVCMAATTGATPGGYDYGAPLVLAVGTQVFDQFYPDAAAQIETSILIIEGGSQGF